MTADEQTALLVEIRDILRNQNELADAQWSSYDRRTKHGVFQWYCFVILQAVLLVYLFVGK